MPASTSLPAPLGLVRKQGEASKAEMNACGNAFRSALWACACSNRLREVEREREKERDLAKERARAVNADNEAVDTDEDEEPWRRRPYRGRWARHAGGRMLRKGRGGGTQDGVAFVGGRGWAGKGWVPGCFSLAQEYLWR